MGSYFHPRGGGICLALPMIMGIPLTIARVERSRNRRLEFSSIFSSGTIRDLRIGHAHARIKLAGPTRGRRRPEGDVACAVAHAVAGPGRAGAADRRARPERGAGPRAPRALRAQPAGTAEAA